GSKRSSGGFVRGFERGLCPRNPARGRHRRGPSRPPPNILAAAPPVDHLAPAPVVIAARLGAPGKIGRGDHRLVVGAVARRGVGLAPAYVEDLQARVRVGLTTGTIRSGNGRGVRNELRHRSL